MHASSLTHNSTFERPSPHPKFSHSFIFVRDHVREPGSVAGRLHMGGKRNGGLEPLSEVSGRPLAAWHERATRIDSSRLLVNCTSSNRKAVTPAAGTEVLLLGSERLEAGSVYE